MGVLFGIIVMNIEFDINEKLKFPDPLNVKEVDDLFIILASNYPNWIVLNTWEYRLFKYLQKDSIINSLTSFTSDYKIKEEKTLSIIQTLLTKIEKVQFYSYTEISCEEKMDTIKKKIQINLTNSCNLRCKHCYLAAGMTKKYELNVEKLIEFLENIYNIDGKTEVVVSGGEPLVYDDIFKIIEYLKSKEHKVILFTNGTLINKNNIKALKRYIDEIQISMEGISKEYYEKIRGIGNYKKLLETISLIRGESIQLTLAITVLVDLLDDIEKELLKFLRMINVTNINVRINGEIEYKGNAINLEDANFEIDYAKEIRIKNIINSLGNNGYNIVSSRYRNIHFSNCGIGTNIVINYDGKIYPCSMYDMDFFNMEDSPFRIISQFNDINNNSGLEKIVCCHDCELRYICNGGCRIKNFLHNGSYTIPFCTDVLKERKYLSLLSGYYEASYEY
jgi:radical SAM protein with 4Fe4S-binding SPASM domain